MHQISSSTCCQCPSSWSEIEKSGYTSLGEKMKAPSQHGLSIVVSAMYCCHWSCADTKLSFVGAECHWNTMSFSSQANTNWKEVNKVQGVLHVYWLSQGLNAESNLHQVVDQFTVQELWLRILLCWKMPEEETGIVPVQDFKQKMEEVWA